MSQAKIKIGKSALALFALVFCAGGPAFAYDEYEVDTTQIGKDSQGVVTSGQILELGVPTASALHIEGENYLRVGKLNAAIAVLQRGLEIAPNDTDIRVLYAEAMEKKLLRQPPLERDPGLYNFVIKQWLCVAKSGEFGDQQISGYNHLGKLAGCVPKRREKERKYLERVLIPEDGSVKVVIGRTGGVPTDEMNAAIAAERSKKQAALAAQKKPKKTDEDL